MNKIKFVIPGEPIAKSRARFFLKNGKITSYDPQNDKKEAVKNYLSLEIAKAFNNDDKEIVMMASKLSCSEAFDVEVAVYTGLSHKLNHEDLNAKILGFEKFVSKPDIDNYCKFYLDCANGILFPDDRMVVCIKATKAYSCIPRVELTIMPLEKSNLPQKAQGILKILGPEKFKEFLEDAKKLGVFFSEDLDLFQELDRPERLAATCSLISFFSYKWADELKKINKKYGDFYKENEVLNECMKSLRDGQNL